MTHPTTDKREQSEKFGITQHYVSWARGLVTVVIFTTTSYLQAQTLECATISKGGGLLPDGSIGVIGQAVVGTMSNEQFSIEVGIVPCLAAAACPDSSPPEPETLPGVGTVASSLAAVNVKNRYVSIQAGDAGRSQAIRVRFVNLPSPFDVWNFANLGTDFFVGEPFQVCENSGQARRQVLLDQGEDCAPAGGLSREWFWTAPLVCDKGAAHVMDWHGECDGDFCVDGLLEGDSCATDEDCVDVVHLFHEGFVPDGVYDVQVVDSSCLL